MRKLKSILIALFIVLFAAQAWAEPDYNKTIRDRYAGIFNKAENIKLWQDAVDLMYPGIRVEKIDFKFLLMGTAPYGKDGKLVEVVGLLAIFLRSWNENEKVTVNIVRLVSLLAVKDTGEILQGIPVAQEDATLTEGWDEQDNIS